MQEKLRHPYFPLFTADFLGGVRFMSPAATGVYIVLLCIEWENGPLPSDLDTLDRVAPGCRDLWHQIASKFDTDQNGRLFNARLERERAYIRKQSENGSRGGRPRNPNRKPDETQTVTQTQSETKAKPKASDSDSDSDSESHAHPETENASRSLAPTAARRQSKPKDTIAWMPATGWTGITEADRAAWGVAYPACDLTRQLAAADQWLRANPTKAHKSLWRKFIAGWLSRAQERGGDAKSNNPNKPADRAAAARAAWGLPPEDNDQ